MFELLPRLIGAFLVAVASIGLLWMVPALLYRRFMARTEWGALGVGVVKAVFWIWTYLVAIVTTSLVVTVLSIEALQDGFDWLMWFLGGLVAVVLFAVASIGLLWMVPALLYRRFMARTEWGAHGIGVVQSVFWIWTTLVGLVTTSLVVNALSIEALQDRFDFLVRILALLFVPGAIAFTIYMVSTAPKRLASRQVDQKAATQRA